jgi:ferric-dicitrate binding protein FerR (iron transport regulator)
LNFHITRPRFLAYLARTLGLALMLSLSPLQNLQAAGPPAIARVLLADGTVRVSRQTGERPLKPGDLVYVSDALATGKDSSVQLVFRKGSLLRLGPDSRLLLSQYPVTMPDDPFHIALTKGMLRFVSGYWLGASPEAFELDTALATLGIRGTDFSVWYTAGGVLAQVHKGAIYARNNRGTAHLRAGGPTGFIWIRDIGQPPGLMEFLPETLDAIPLKAPLPDPEPGPKTRR